MLNQQLQSIPAGYNNKSYLIRCFLEFSIFNLKGNYSLTTCIISTVIFRNGFTEVPDLKGQMRLTKYLNCISTGKV